MLTTFQPEKFKLLSRTFANAIRMALYYYPPVQCIYYQSIVYLVRVCATVYLSVYRCEVRDVYIFSFPSVVQV